MKEKFTACAFWQSTGSGHVWCLTDGSVVAHDWVKDLDPRLFFPTRESAQAALSAAQTDGRISRGMRVCVNDAR
jgi:hypothetical protein